MDKDNVRALQSHLPTFTMCLSWTTEPFDHLALTQHSIPPVSQHSNAAPPKTTRPQRRNSRLERQRNIPSNFVVTSVNVNGFPFSTNRPSGRARDKVRSLQLLCAGLGTQVLCIQETHHLSSETVDATFLPGFRLLAQSAGNDARRVGGAAILVKEAVCAEAIPTPVLAAVSCCAARICLEGDPKITFAIVCVYVPPVTPKAHELILAIPPGLPPSMTCLWAGDFNPDTYPFNAALEDMGGVELNDRDCPTYGLDACATTPGRMFITLDPSLVPDIGELEYDPDAPSEAPGVAAKLAHEQAYPARRIAHPKVSDHKVLSWAIPLPHGEPPSTWARRLEQVPQAEWDTLDAHLERTLSQPPAHSPRAAEARYRAILETVTTGLEPL